MQHIAKKIKKIRLNEKLSQAQFGSLLGVSDKAVSRWETAAAAPTLENLIKIKQLFGVSVDDMLNSDSTEKEISMIVLTGGPCAGKTTAQGWIETNFTKLGYKVLFIPETATELINGGIFPSRNGPGSPGLNNVDFQYELIRLQLAKEEVFLEAAEKMPAAK